jgi:uncharacterized protein (DUF302 family)
MRENEYALHRSLPGISYEEAIDRVTEALQEEGFGILTSIDVQSTLKAKIGADFRSYVILGACNPVLAHSALAEDDNIGLLLPCNVVVAATEDGAEVGCLRPDQMMLMAGPAIEHVAQEAQEKLQRVMEAL